MVKIDVIDSKDNYKYHYEEDVPDDDEGAEVWPYDNDFDEIWEHNFVDVSSTPTNEEIRNKLTPLKNFITIMENEKHCNIRVRQLIKSEIPKCKEIIEYLSKIGG